MKRVTGIGGIFFKSENPENLKNWYHTHLGVSDVFKWKDITQPQVDLQRKPSGVLLKMILNIFRPVTNHLCLTIA